MCVCACQGEDPSDSLAQRSHSRHQELRGSAPGSNTSLPTQGAVGRTSPLGAGLTAPGPRGRGGPLPLARAHLTPPPRPHRLSLEEEGNSETGYSMDEPRTSAGHRHRACVALRGQRHGTGAGWGCAGWGRGCGGWSAGRVLREGG